MRKTFLTYGGIYSFKKIRSVIRLLPGLQQPFRKLPAARKPKRLAVLI
jgi:hypothetical protein